MASSVAKWKILVVGDMAVGKTALIQRLVHNTYTVGLKATIGVDFAPKKLGERMLHLWDIAGQERFNTLSRTYYREARGAIIVYDLTVPASKDSIIKWIHSIQKDVSFPGTEKNEKPIPIPIVLFANKCDAETIDDDELDELQKKYEVCKMFRTSAKDNINLDEGLAALVENIELVQSRVGLEVETPKKIDLDKRNEESKCCGSS